MQSKVVHVTYEIEHGDYTYRIFSNQINDHNTIKRIRKDTNEEANWSHGVMTDMWDGEKFTHTFRAKPAILGSLGEALKVISEQENVNA